MTDVASSEICADLMSVLNMAGKPGESSEDFTLRAVYATQKLSEDKWAELQDDTQQWVNDWMELEEQKNKGEDVELPLLVAEDDGGIPEFLQRKPRGNGRTNGKEIAPSKAKPKTEPEEETEAEPVEAALKRQGRPPAEWSVKKVLALHNEFAAELRNAGVSVKDRKILLNRAQAHEALAKLQSAFAEAGVDHPDDLAKALEAMGTPGKGGRPATKEAASKAAKLEVKRQVAPRKVTLPVEKKQVTLEPSYQKAQDEAAKHFAPHVKVDHARGATPVGNQHPVIAALLERFPKSGDSEHEHELWISVLKGSLELFT